ncbi:hypothetical protein [Phycicoccus endophyticus]|uniref:hypothetical protein n=1 Tax=Phycicoccus endophyticus TaxID=1690220 RepID=UPI00166364EC|nr:hypothetical protein [Phycicoccus endophyticus]GGL42187.1 hypothetical protein GCM10012283_25980 [Phycicoccus endophyticus]
MSVLAAVLVALAVLLAVGVPAAPARSAPRRPPWSARVARRVRGGRGRPGAGWVADLAEVTAVGLRAGLDLPAAVEVAARAPAVQEQAPWMLAALHEAHTTGAGPADVVVGTAGPEAAPPDRAALDVVGRAWRLSQLTGSEASRTTAAAAAALRASAAAQERTDSALSGPRASMRLLTALPFGGPVVGALLGLSPVQLYGSAAARAAACCGLVLTALGWAWARRMVGGAARPGRTSGSG